MGESITLFGIGAVFLIASPFGMGVSPELGLALAGIGAAQVARGIIRLGGNDNE